MNCAVDSKVIKKETNSISPISILGLNIKQNISHESFVKYLKDVKEGPTIECLTFLAFFLQAERFLRDCDSSCPWDLPQDVPHPNGFFANITFDEFVHFNNAIVSELRVTRHCILHNQGIKDKSYYKQQKRYFSDYSSIYKKMDANLNTENQDGHALPFLDKVKARMDIAVGEKLPISFEYLYHAQLALLDRVGLKSNYYNVTWSLKEGATDHVFKLDLTYDFKPFY